MKAETFGQLLAQLGLLEETAGKREAGPHFRFSAGAGLAVLSLAPQKAGGPAHRAWNYEEVLEERQAAPPISLADLAREIAKATTIQELRRLRRAFARLRHPDQCHAGAGQAATSEMAAANRLIDDAMISLRRRCPPKL
jgi:hypothetical protein